MSSLRRRGDAQPLAITYSRPELQLLVPLARRALGAETYLLARWKPDRDSSRF
jgi:hypothetical protein